MRKKRILFHSDFALVKTGFGRVMKTLLSYLYKTKKYEIHHVCCGLSDNAPELQATPWKSYGAVSSDPQKLQQANADPHLSRTIGYGSQTIDEYVKQIKPDIYIGVQDFWGLDFSIDKNWFNKITSCVWTTLDSLPILPSAAKRAKDIKNYWVWSNFAEKALHKLGYPHVETVHGPIECDCFYRLSDEQRKKIRVRSKIPEDSIVIGFVFRNQLRKLVPNLVEGYKLWKDRHPEIKNSYLLLHTSFSEGWNIKSQCDQHNVDSKEILTTYICSHCGEYEVKSFDDRLEKHEKNQDGSYKLDKNNNKIEISVSAEGKDCPFCNSKNAQKTTSVGLGVTENQLNEVYNLMDVYVHPFTSGGQEIPIQEAKLAELITLVTNYSCGEECCEDGAYSLKLDWNKYLEHGTEFIKASTKPSSIADQLDVFMKMSNDDKRLWGKKAREWTINNFSIENVGKKIENFIKKAPLIDENDINNFSQKEVRNQNPNAVIDQTLTNRDWVKSLYKLILDREVENDDEGLLYWLDTLSKNTPKDQVENYFRHVAKKDLEESRDNPKEKNKFSDFILNNSKKKLLYVIPRSIGDCFLSTAVISSLRKIYLEEEWDIYVSSEQKYKSVFDGNKNITNWIPYHPEMENHILMEGSGENNGWFDICFTPHISTQRSMNYIHNGLNKLLL
jgi:glycosyltransferase involved in cell wall biosynthesis